MPLPTKPLTKKSPFKLPQTQSRSYHCYNNPDSCIHKHTRPKTTKSQKELYTMERTWNANLSRCTKKTLDDTRKIGVLDQELRLLNLCKKSNVGLTKLDNSFEFMKNDALSIARTITFWATDNEEAEVIFKEIDMDNNKKLSISEIHRYIMTKYIKVNAYMVTMKFRIIIKLGVNKINPHSGGYVNLKEFVELMKYINIWKRMY